LIDINCKKHADLFNITTARKTMLKHVNGKNNNQLEVMEMTMAMAKATLSNSTT